MQNDIWLYKSHQNFQVGKSHLKKGSVFQTNFYQIIFGLIVALVVLWFAGKPLRQQIQFWQTGRETIGVVTDCRQISGKGSHTLVSYYYLVSSGDEPMRYDAEDQVSYGLVCEQYPIDSPNPVFYLGDNPQESGINAFVHGDEWIPSLIFGGFAILGIVAVFTAFLQNREERRKHALLQRNGILLNGCVMELGTSHANKSLYHFAPYQFETPTGHYLVNRIESRKQYPWPKHIQKGDTLHILYLDDETYCVL